MNLIIFAHKKEAQAFLASKKKREFAVLVTGEGIANVLKKVAAFLDQNQVDKLINLGIAASLKRLPLGTIHRVGKFSTSMSQQVYAAGAGLHCLTYHERVFDSSGLSADLVDREAWAIAHLATQHQLPFESHKLISDYADQQTSTADVIRQMPEWSLKLYHYYNQLN